MHPAWTAILRSLETEPRPIHQIRGASGYPHDIIAAGIDEKRRRLVILSPEPEPRVAAMVQADIQAADDSIQVLTARPILYDITKLNQTIADAAGKTEVSREEMWEALASNESDLLARSGMIIHFTGEGPGQLPASHIMQSMMQQLMLGMPPVQSPFLAERLENPTVSELANSKVDLTSLGDIDVLAGDRAAGICPLPIAQFTPAEIAVLLTGQDVDTAANILRAYGVLQYFFPTPDHVALGLIEREEPTRPQLDQQLMKVPMFGHPYAPPEVVSASTSLDEIIDALKEKKLVVEGEFSTEITPEGRSLRSTVRFKPREGLLSKLINRFSVSFDLKDLFKQ